MAKNTNKTSQPYCSHHKVNYLQACPLKGAEGTHSSTATREINNRLLDRKIVTVSSSSPLKEENKAMNSIKVRKAVSRD